MEPQAEKYNSVAVVVILNHSPGPAQIHRGRNHGPVDPATRPDGCIKPCNFIASFNKFLTIVRCARKVDWFREIQGHFRKYYYLYKYLSYE